MTIIRSKVSQDFTLIVNRVTEDKEFDSKYLGTFLRLISKGEGWEISAAGLASLYPTNGVEFYRNAIKHMCKLGYLVKIPQPRHKGHFVKSVMELYDSRQIETPLDDKIVDKLFSIEDMTEEQIKIIYPQRVSRRGSLETANHTKESKEEESKDNNAKVGKPTSCCESPKDTKPEQSSSCLTQDSSIKENLKAKVDALDFMTKASSIIEKPLTEVQVMLISKNHTLELIRKAVELAALAIEIKAPYQWLCRCMKEKWWLTVDPEKTDAYYLFNKLKELLFKIKSTKGAACQIDIEEKSINIQHPKVGALEITADWLSKLDDPKKFIDTLNNKYILPEKLNYDTINGKTRLELGNYEN